MDGVAPANVLNSRPHIQQVQKKIPASEKRNRIWIPALIVLALGFIAILFALPRPNIFFPATSISPALMPAFSPEVPTTEPTIASPIPPTVDPTNATPAPPTVESTSISEDGYMEQETYTGDCANRPTGSVCIVYSDGFKWLVYDAVSDRGDGGLWEENRVEIIYGFQADYYHVLGTSLVKAVPK